MTNDVAGHGRLLRYAPLILLVASVGCRDYTDNTPRPTPPTARYPATVADPLPDGRVHGRVVWEGERPVVPPVAGLIDSPTGPAWGETPNPFAPRIADDGGMADVVVWLSPLDATKLKPWPHPPLVVEHADGKLRSVQAGVPERVGFVKVGDEVELRTRGSDIRLLRARGAAFFTLAFPEPDRPRKRRLDTPGVVEFTSTTGDFWNVVDVIVCEHPYYAATDSAGRFELANVPPGEYQLSARVRRWEVTGRDRDPETGKLVRLKFDPPQVVVRKVNVPAIGTVEVEVTVRATAILAE
jgi:hypothetical protein